MLPSPACPAFRRLQYGNYKRLKARAGPGNKATSIGDTVYAVCSQFTTYMCGCALHHNNFCAQNSLDTVFSEYAGHIIPSTLVKS